MPDRSIAWLALAALPLAAAGPVHAQHERHAAAPAAELGRLEFANSGAAAAQAPFLRGVLALHSFWFEEARAAFAQAREIDPGFALAYWAEAVSWDQTMWGGRNAERGRAVLAAADSLPEHERARWTERERMYVDAARELLADGPARERRTAFTAALECIIEAYPEDDEAVVFHALGVLATSSHGGEDREPIMEAAERLERIFRRNPDHPGVLHYLIHAYDHPDLAERGLPMARRYAAAAPAAFHAVHMPAHIFRHLELWEEVAATCRAAYEVSVAWVEREGLPDRRRDFHSLDWWHDALLRLGRLDEARALHDHMRELVARNPDDEVIARELRILERAYARAADRGPGS